MEKSEIARPISTILDGSNYITWANQMKSFLIGQKLWRIVTGDIAKPTKQDKEDDGKFIERLEEWDSKNHQIITWLSNTSIPAIHTQFDAFESAKELWDFLSTRFKSVGLAHYYQLHNNLVNLNQEAGQSVNEYLAVLQPIWTQLDQANISKDHLRLIKVLMGLRPEYESVRAALLHRSPLPSLDAAIQEILFEEKRLGINLSNYSDVVLASTYSPPDAHFVRILISSSSSALAVSSGNRWLLDSACCNHMTSNYSLMNTPSPAKSLPPIYAADGNCMNITHIGTVNTPSMNLPHTYCVPNLTFNLVSVGQLCDLGLTVSFSPNGCQVQDPQTGQTIGTGRKVGRLFELLSLQVPSPSSISVPVTDSDTYQWHLRLGHASPEKLRHLIFINHLNSTTKFVPFNCLNCKLAKQPALSFFTSTSISDKPFDLIHSDIWGPAPTSTVHGYRYYVTFIDDFSRFTWIYFLKHRSALSRTYIEFANMIRTQFSCPIKTLRTDNALEYKDSTLLSFLSQQGTLVQRSCAHTSQQNGRAERKHRHILDSVRALLLSASCPEKFWGEAALTSVYTINRLPSSVLQNISPFEKLYGTPPNYSNLKTFGCACFVLLHPHEHTKLEPRARLCCFLGYGTEHKGFRCWDPLSNRLRLSRHITFWEHTMFSRLSSFHTSFSSPQAFFTNTSIDLFPPSESPLGNELAQSAPTSATSDQSSISDGSPEPTPDTPPRRSTRVREPPIHLQDYHYFSTIISLVEPTSYQEASTNPLWQKAMNDELQALEKTHTWDYVDLPPGKRPIGCKWIYKIKTHSDGTIERYKAHLVAKGYSQEYGIDYEETFAPVARMTSVRSLLVVAAAKQWPLLQMDVKNTFLNGTLSEEVYMKPPPGTSPPPHKGIVLLLLYVDDMIITGNDPQAISDLQHYLGQHFEMKDLGSLNYFLGLEVSRRSDGYLLSQAKYASDLLARSGITDSNTASTPLDPNVHLTPCDGVPLEEASLYRQLVGSLIYLTVTRPDIAYVVHIVSQFMAAPRTIHFTVVLRILRYIKGTLGHGLQILLLLGDSLISWGSKKQSVVSRSSTESEYRALADTTAELLWLRWLLADKGVPQQGPTLLYCDNRSAIQIAHNDVFHERTKHIENDCHFIRHHLLSNTLLLQPVSTTEQPADIFTKALPSTRFNQLRTKLKLTATLPP
ncbi:Retrovirus-related Pol polyprotein from transposon TNT 1-94 [Cucumis melo var. makuwa]|uniref:Retrovirus-related Pol polyprotein from transposon TNT 1-94 n=1 Tax=Cucumis melo var. makuwa TaxID=1194695 RepID=A0A5A7TZC4_CUCMM|nr:Retrovirus-related Pol polyprotein from transposon TNT 1-94 [Cucumis melo var. makuwa]